MNKWSQHYQAVFGAMELSDNDAARHVFATGWNCALQEMLEQILKMPMERDTQASFAVYLQTLMCVDPNEVQGGPNGH